MARPRAVGMARFRRLSLAVILVSGVIGSSGLVAQPAFAAESPGDFSSSFESSDATPLVSTVAVGAGAPIRENVRAQGPGDFTSTVINTSASEEHPPNEISSKLPDSNSSTKWLAFESTAWLLYQFDAPHVVTSYSMTSANDSDGRDPQNWTLQGSTDGSTWTTIDTQTGVDFSKRRMLESFPIAQDKQAAYAYFKLDITKNAGDSLTQLADWNLVEHVNDGDPQVPMVTAVGTGPSDGYNIKSNLGFTGKKAFMYSGEAIKNGAASETNVVYDGLSIVVGQDTRLSYKIFPELTNGDLQYPSTYAAIDLQFTDGTYLSSMSPMAQHDVLLTAKGQGQGKILYGSQWNAEQSDIGAIAEGKTIEAILLTYDNPEATKKTAFQGWIDDLKIESSPAKIDGSSLTNYVDTRRGTNASGRFSRGATLPMTALPNGFNFYEPMTDSNSTGRSYLYAQDNNSDNFSTFQGLGVSHEPSPWMGDRDTLSVQPSTSETPSGSANSRELPFSHNNETAKPDYYSVTVNNGIKAEMTPSDHSVIMRYTFPDNKGSLTINTSNDEGDFDIASDGTVTGWVDNGSGYGRPRMFVYGEFDKTPTATAALSGSHKGAKYASFDAKTVQLRLATSFLSQSQAQKNFGFEVEGKSFSQVHSTATDIWNAKLGVLHVEGASDTKLRTLYSNLYRLNLYPNEQHENTGTASNPVYKYASPVSDPTGSDSATNTGSKIVTGKLYVNNGFWDTYRTVWPAYSLLYPKFAAEIVDGFVQQYRDGGWVARWSSPGYANIMTGTSSDVAFADAYMRGVDLKDPLATYDAAVKNATVVPHNASVGRKGLTSSIFLGYTPTSTGESVSWALEGFINDYGIGNMAAKLAVDPDIIANHPERVAQLKEDSTYFLNRARDYVNMFDPAVDFFQGKSADGKFAQSPQEYDPTVWGGAYTETDGWNFAFHAPQDGNGLANLYGGRQGLENKLDAVFSTPEVAKNTGISGGVIHEQAEARDVRMGQVGMSNQVSHHIPYMYDYTDSPYKTQKVVREALHRLFIGDEIGQGYPGDEDNGEMSAWYILSSLGIYPLQAGSSNWAIGSPQFTKATVTRDNGKSFTVNATNNSPTNVYVQSLSVNGQPQSKTWIDQSALDNDGAVLNFTMGASPSAFGSHADDAPPSLTTGSEVAKPLKDTTAKEYGSATARDGEATAALFDNTSGTQVTFNSSTPVVTFEYDNAKQTVSTYTLTSGTTPGDPQAWALEGSNDGTNWTTLDERSNVTFAYRQQTRPFGITTPGSFGQYRLSVTDSTLATPSISEIELIADPAKSDAGALAFKPSGSLSATSGSEATLNLGVASGGVGADASAYTASVDWGDSSDPTAATLSGRGFESYDVAGRHTFAKPGTYRVVVTVSDGQTQTSGVVMIEVNYVAADSLVGAFNNTCIGDDGVGNANCDDKTWAYSRTALKDVGVEQGKPIAVPGTDLSFTLPVVAPGEADNAIGAGQTFRVSLPSDATQFSFIGTGTQGNQDTSGTVTFTDNTSETIPIQFTDWTIGGHPNNDASFGNIKVAMSDYRLYGASTDSAKPFLFSTAPYTIPAGKTVASITLPDQSGTDAKSAGRIHVFALAMDGTQVEQLKVTPSDAIKAKTGKEITATLGTITGGVPLEDGSYTARVQWGDASVTEDATVSVTGGIGAITGTHTYDDAGDYTVSVTAADTNGSVAMTVAAHITSPTVYTPTIVVETTGDVHAGDKVKLSGSGFAPNEDVELALSTSPKVTKTVHTNDDGAFSDTITVPKSTTPGLYGVTATGATSNMPATVNVEVAQKPTTPTYSPDVTLMTTAGSPGHTVGVEGEGFAPNEKVTMTLHSKVVALGIVTTNSQGVLTGSFVIPNVAFGKYSVELVGSKSKTPVSTALVVLEPNATPGSNSNGSAGNADGANGSPLARTGLPENVGLFGLFGLLMFALGGVVLMRSRRRRLQ